MLLKLRFLVQVGTELIKFAFSNRNNVVEYLYLLSSETTKRDALRVDAKVAERLYNLTPA